MTRDADVLFAHSRDASGIELVPEGVARASSVDDVVEVVRFAAGTGTAVTPAGSQTSMTAASITDHGLILSLAAMTRIADVDVERRVARVEPGVRIGDLNRTLAEHGLMFAPDPTSEEDATIGGAIACNASGARSLHYGPTRNHVNALSIVHADGEVACYSRFRPEKNAVGYAAAQDPVDWFVGSEGTLGIVVEAELSLVRIPFTPIGLAIPFRTETAALDFVVAARSRESRRSPRCLEFFDAGALAIAADSAGLPWTESALALVYLEDDAGRDGDVDEVLAAWLRVAEANDALSGDIRVYEGAQALREARVMRHAVPATMNERGARFRHQGGRKISTDWAVHYRRLGEALAVSREAIERHGAPSPVTYGHAGNGHPHQNFIAEDGEALNRIQAAIEETLVCVVRMGGTVSAEHGLGKLKRRWLGLQLGARQIELMRAMKNVLDPSGMFSPGNVL
ncbi:MAG: FAD-binding oxidoreductase [Gemmatimonadaceae bacterium]|nr:FAD-binding oxidoreductase [Gemmatimonadaceae bacterium]